ncbi:MAG: hypothetical protein K5695_09600 [Oscillospiraceae bacterium]|nr:hypothetical protein [Oscillospiraceae bacterium]
MRIELNSGGLATAATLSMMQSDLTGLLRGSERMCRSFELVRSAVYNMNGGVGCLQDALGGIEARIQTDSGRAANVKQAEQKVSAFVDLVRTTDSKVSGIVVKNQEEFYQVNAWARPVADVSASTKKTLWDKVCDWFGNAGDSIADGWNKVCDWFRGVGKSIGDTFEKVKKSIEEFIQKKIDKIKEDFSIFDDPFYDKLGPTRKFMIFLKISKMKEPYRSIYLDNYKKYSIGNTEGKDTGYYSPDDNTINVNMSKQFFDERGAYNTFFHESGHAIDYNYQDDGNYYSLTYKNAEGKTLQDVLYEDVREDITNTTAKYAKDPQSQEQIVNYLMGARSVDISTLSPTDQAIVKQIQADYRKRFSGAVNASPSDVYGGVTNNLIIGDYGHRPDTKNGETYNNFGYWYDQNGEATGFQSLELWAEYYSYAATGDKGNMKALAKYFPRSKEFLDEMAQSMVNS